MIQLKELAEKKRAGLLKLSVIKIKGIPTAELEKFVDSLYEAGAPQEELDLLKTLFDERVSEDDQSVTEEEQNISEETHQGAGLAEQLIECIIDI